MKHAKKLLALLLTLALALGLALPAMAEGETITDPERRKTIWEFIEYDLVAGPFLAGIVLVDRSFSSIGTMMVIFAPITFLVGWFMGLFKLI